MSEPHVVLGMQGMQMPANAIRGIGRWCTEFTLALLESNPGTIAAVSVDAQLPLPRVEARLLSLGVPILSAEQPPPGLAEGEWVFHVLSPLEDLPIERVWPRWARDPSVGLTVTVFDMIPLLFPSDYFQGSLKRLLQVRYEMYRSAGSVIGISQATVDDAIRLLDLDPERTFVVSGGVSDRFVPHACGRHGALLDLSALGLRADFVLTIGNVDPRKNLVVLMEAYAGLPPELRREHQLVMTCSQADRHHLGLLRGHADRFGIADQVVILPYVADDVMVRLYQACAFMVYPSQYEGLGLPILEAQACGAAVLASDVGPMREIVSEPAARFDPNDAPAIRRRVEHSLTDRSFLARLRESAVGDAARYTWARSTKAALDAYRWAAA